jgi:hypothetical protein
MRTAAAVVAAVGWNVSFPAEPAPAVYPLLPVNQNKMRVRRKLGDSLFKDKVDRDFAVTTPAHLSTIIVLPRKKLSPEDLDLKSPPCLAESARFPVSQSPN